MSYTTLLCLNIYRDPYLVNVNIALWNQVLVGKGRFTTRWEANKYNNFWTIVIWNEGCVGWRE